MQSLFCCDWNVENAEATPRASSLFIFWKQNSPNVTVSSKHENDDG